MAYTVNEFAAAANTLGQQLWPATKVSPVLAAGSLTLQPNTVAIIVTADADGRMVIDTAAGVLAAGVTTTPIIAAIENAFAIANSAASTPTVVRFT